MLKVCAPVGCAGGLALGMRAIWKLQLAQVLSVSSLMDEAYLERKLGEQAGEEVRASLLSLKSSD